MNNNPRNQNRQPRQGQERMPRCYEAAFAKFTPGALTAWCDKYNLAWVTLLTAFNGKSGIIQAAHTADGYPNASRAVLQEVVDPVLSRHNNFPTAQRADLAATRQTAADEFRAVLNRVTAGATAEEKKLAADKAAGKEPAVVANRAVFQKCKMQLLNTTTDPGLAKMLREQMDRFFRIVAPDHQDFFFGIIAKVEGQGEQADKVKMGVIRETMRTMSKFPNDDDCVQRLADEGLLVET